MEKEHVRKRVSRGGRNLVLLGICSILIALLTTGVSLAIYHNSGDIYLDRSRPGFLPDEEEIEEEEDDSENFDFSKSGALNVEQVEEYIEKLKNDISIIDTEKNPYNGKVLSDESLGIPKPKEE